MRSLLPASPSLEMSGFARAHVCEKIRYPYAMLEEANDGHSLPARICYR